jgi:hypothetical protein
VIAIATRLTELTGNEPVLMSDAMVSEQDRADYNLILVGTPDTNSLLNEVYEIADVARVTSEYPGPNRALLEVLASPWNASRGVLIVAGADEWGVKAGSIMVTDDDRINELSGEVMAGEYVPDEDGAEPYAVTITVPSGYLQLWISPGNISAEVGEQIEISCKVMPLINTPVDIISIDLALFDSNGSLLRTQPMALDAGMGANAVKTVVGDEASFRLLVNFSINPLRPEYFSEYTADAFPVVVNK